MPRATLPHRARPALDAKAPLHVTLRMTDRVYSLRSARSFCVIERALRGGAERFGMRVIRVSIQGNHVHLLVEASSRHALTRGMRGLSIRLARGMNRMMRDRGRVIADRYHARSLRTPTEVRTVMHYLEHNRRHHVPSLPHGYVDVFVLSSHAVAGLLPEPATWLLRVGWRRGRVAKSAMRWR